MINLIPHYRTLKTTAVDFGIAHFAGQQDLAKKLLAKMAELNEKLGANMMQLEE